MDTLGMRGAAKIRKQEANAATRGRNNAAEVVG
jgi:hypothetical protein